MNNFFSLKKIRKFFISGILVFVVLYVITCLYFKVTDGFSVSNITPQLSLNVNWEVAPLNVNEIPTVEKALNQNYHYFAKGHQVYVFISEDSEYLIKFPKFQRITPKPWIHWLPLPATLEPWRQAKIQKKAKVVDNFMTSWKLSYEELKYETAVLFVHINPTNKVLNKTITFTDKIGRKHPLDMDKMVFLIQRKVKMFIPAIEDLVNANDYDGAKVLLDNLLKLYVSENQRGMVEKDYQIMRNTGFIGDRPLQIDIGRFFKDESLKIPEISRKEMRYKTQKLMPWLIKNHPSLALHLEKRIENLYKDDFIQ